MLRNYRVTTGSEVHERNQHLLDFFEHTSLFLLNIYLSAGDSPVAPFDPKLVKKDHGVRDIERAEFGAWVKWGADLASEIRKLMNDNDTAGAVSQAFRHDTDIVEKLVSKKLWDILDKARAIRNRIAHGQSGKSALAQANEEGEKYLLDLREALGGVFESSHVLEWKSSERSEATGRYVTKCKLQVTSNSIFELTELSLAEGLFPKRLYLNQSGKNEVLPLLPLFSMTTPAESDQSRVIFFDQVEGDGILYVDKQTSETVLVNVEKDPSIARVLDLFSSQSDS